MTDVRLSKRQSVGLPLAKLEQLRYNKSMVQLAVICALREAAT